MRFQGLAIDLKKKGIESGFFITIETVDANKIFEYENATTELTSKGVQINRNEMYKQGLDVCCVAIKDPKYDDSQLLNFLGITMKHPTPEEVWKKLFLKSEIQSIGQIIIDFSKKNIDEDEYIENLNRFREKVKNS